MVGSFRSKWGERFVARVEVARLQRGALRVLLDIRGESGNGQDGEGEGGDDAFHVNLLSVGWVDIDYGSSVIAACINSVSLPGRRRYSRNARIHTAKNSRRRNRRGGGRTAAPGRREASAEGDGCVLQYNRLELDLREALGPRAFDAERHVPDRFTAVVEHATGRPVIGFMSGNQQDPDMICEVFVLSPTDLIADHEMPVVSQARADH